MSRPYSTDLRDRVVAYVDEGHSCREASKLFSVSVASVVRWTQRVRAVGHSAPKQIGGYRRPTLLSERDWLLARVAAAPDLTLRGLQAELAARGRKVAYATVWSFLSAEGLTFKKKPARSRTASSGRRALTRALEASPAQD